MRLEMQPGKQKYLNTGKYLSKTLHKFMQIAPHQPGAPYIRKPACKT